MLKFTPVTIQCTKELLPFAQKLHTRSCDYTTGNLIMWSGFMHYRYAIEKETLFISCLSQMDLKSNAFLPPIGKLPLKESIAILHEYCRRNGEKLRFTAVPQNFLEEIKSNVPNCTITQLEGWSDYIYNAESLATLQGKALNKKRNRYNKFISENPEYIYSRYNDSDRTDVIKFLITDRDCQHNREENMRCYEQWQCINTVRNLSTYQQPAAIIRINGEIVAFTLGEIFGDMLYIHIEKAKREIPGAAEAINRFFVNDMITENPSIKLVNREEDLGDPGLQQAKKAYNPQELLHRYEIIYSDQETIVNI